VDTEGTKGGYAFFFPKRGEWRIHYKGRLYNHNLLTIWKWMNLNLD